MLLKVGTVADATLIAAPSSTKNKDHKRDPDMHFSKKGEQMYCGMKAHTGADADSRLVHTVRGTSGNVLDVLEGNSLLHGEEPSLLEAGTRQQTRCLSKPRNSKRAYGPKWSTRFG